jgi:hypothetical protein
MEAIVTEFGSAEYWRRLRALASVGLASENLPPMGAGGILPQEGSGWNLMIVEDGSAGTKSHWYVTDLGTQMLDEPDVALFDEGIEQIGWINEGRVPRRRSQWKAVLSLTLFLPLMLVLGILRFPSHPGSLHTFGQVVVGFGAVLAIVGFIVGLFTQNWLLAGVSAYWWIGAKVIESEGRARGLLV